MSGTSMATPVVSGAAAVLVSMALAAGQTLTPLQLRTILMSTVDPISGGSNYLASGGRINLAKAVTQLQTTISQRTDGTTALSALTYMDNVTLANPKNASYPYLYARSTGEVYTSSKNWSWMRYYHSASGTYLFKTPGGRWLSTNGGTCSSMATYTSYDSAYRRWKMIAVPNTSPTQRWFASSGCSTSTLSKYITTTLRISSDTTRRITFVMTKVV